MMFGKAGNHDNFSDSVTHWYKIHDNSHSIYITYYLVVTNRKVWVYLGDQQRCIKIKWHAHLCHWGALAWHCLCAMPLERSGDRARLNGWLAMSEPHTGTKYFPGRRQCLGRSGSQLLTCSTTIWAHSQVLCCANPSFQTNPWSCCKRQWGWTSHHPVSKRHGLKAQSITKRAISLPFTQVKAHTWTAI